MFDCHYTPPPFSALDPNINSPSCPPYISYNFSLEILVLDQ